MREGEKGEGKRSRLLSLDSSPFVVIELLLEIGIRSGNGSEIRGEERNK